MSPNIREQRNKLQQRVMSHVGKAKKGRRKPELWVRYVREKCRGVQRYKLVSVFEFPAL